MCKEVVERKSVIDEHHNVDHRYTGLCKISQLMFKHYQFPIESMNDPFKNVTCKKCHKPCTNEAIHIELAHHEILHQCEVYDMVPHQATSLRIKQRCRHQYHLTVHDIAHIELVHRKNDDMI